MNNPIATTEASVHDLRRGRLGNGIGFFMGRLQFLAVNIYG
jgi:hypothetical protein